MAGTIILTKSVLHPDGRFENVYTLNEAGGSGRIWSTKDDALLIIPALESDENLVAMHLAYWAARSADLTNTAVMLNKTLTVDFSAANPIRLQ